jgi:hypothetical protein
MTAITSQAHRSRPTLALRRSVEARAIEVSRHLIDVDLDGAVRALLVSRVVRSLA